MHGVSFSQENFRGALCLQHLNTVIIRSLYNINEKTFAPLLKNAKTPKVSPANLSSFTVYGNTYFVYIVHMCVCMYIIK